MSVNDVTAGAKKQRFRWIALGALALLLPWNADAQVSLYTAVDLALRNSTAVRIAQADVAHAAGVVRETKDAYIPNLILGSSLGPPSYGFPLGQPSIFNVQSQSLLFTFSQKDYVRATRAGLRAAQLTLQDDSQQVVLDASLDYIQLDEITRQLAAMDQERGFAEKLVGIEQDRVINGVDSRMDLIRAELTSAQVDLKRIHLQNQAGLLRQQLSHLTGLVPESFITETKSIPPPPDFQTGENVDRNLSQANPGLEAAYANAQSKVYAWFGDKRQNYRPQFSFGAQYSLFSTFNNYANYYRSFQQNNFGAAIQITVPLFSASTRAKAQESAADAVHAEAQADQSRNQLDEQVFQMQKGLAELAAQQRVAQLQSDLAQEQLQTVEAELQTGTGSATAAPVSPKDAEEARIQERQRYEDMLDANFAVTRSQLSLLRAIGIIDEWWRKTPQSAIPAARAALLK